MQPVVLLSHPHNQCATFYWSELPGFYTGYRIIEYQPETLPAPCEHYERQPRADWGDLPAPQAEPLPPTHSDPLLSRWMTTYQEADPQDPIQLNFQAFSDGSAWCQSQENGGNQTREMFFQPDENGIRFWLRVTTRTSIPGGYALQQCLRYTGRFNEPWRTQISHVPLLSEFDIQAMGDPNVTLTYARRGDSWWKFPVQHAAVPTLAGQPYHENNDWEPVDHGLILRESINRKSIPVEFWNRVAHGMPMQQLTSGMYWERTAYISNRHPADCLHSCVDFGPLEAGQSRTVHGKFYWIEGSKDDLLAAWKQDFQLLS